MEMVWEAAEVNFRFEFLALDARASGLSRSDACRQSFPSNALVGFDIAESRMGFSAIAPKDRLPYVLNLARLMLDWQPRPRPAAIAAAFDQPPPDWEAAIEEQGEEGEWQTTRFSELEDAVAEYYTQCFYDIIGRAAVVPLRLTHEFGL